MRRVVIPGGSGFLGRSLAEYLVERGYEIVILTRSPKEVDNPKIKEIEWDGKTIGEWVSEFEGADAVVNMTGKSVNCIYTPENKEEIINSRVDSVKVIGVAIKQCVTPPKTYVQAASLAIYGSPETICDEDSPLGSDDTEFPVHVCKLWEGSIASLDLPGTKLVVLRIGLVLGEGGGALKPLIKITKLFLGGTVGHGRQYFSWIHDTDMNEMFRWAIERDDIVGTFNGTGPTPVTNALFMRGLRKALHRPWCPPAPAFAVKIGAKLFMRTEPSLALNGRGCVPKRFLEKGFKFKFNDLDESLKDLL